MREGAGRKADPTTIRRNGRLLTDDAWGAKRAPSQVDAIHCDACDCTGSCSSLRALTRVAPRATVQRSVGRFDERRSMRSSLSARRSRIFGLLFVAWSIPGCLLDRHIIEVEDYWGFCQTGICKTAPFCADPAGRFVGDLVLNTSAFLTCESEGNQFARPRRIRDRDNIIRDLFCVGPTASPALDSKPEVSTVHANPVFSLPDPDILCRFAPSALPVGTAPSPMPPCTLTAEVAGSCDFTAGPGGDWARKLSCPQKTVWGSARWRLRIQTEGLGTGLERAFRYQAALCNLYSAPTARDVDFATLGAGNTNTASLAFVRADSHPRPPPLSSFLCSADPNAPNSASGVMTVCGHILTAEGREPSPRLPAIPLDDNNNPIGLDPGATPTGRHVVLDSTASLLTVTEGTSSASVPLEGTVEIASPGTAGAFHVADMTVRQATSSVSFKGVTIAHATIASIAVWSGSIAGDTTFSLLPSSVVFDVTAQIDGIRRELTFSPTSSPTGTYNAATGAWILDLSVADSGRLFVVHMQGTATNIPPTATIATFPPAGETEIECTSSAGVSFSVSGSTTNATQRYWSLSNSNSMLYNTNLTATFSLPLLVPSAPAELLSLVGLDSPYAASDSRRIRVVDRTPPAILQTTIKPACKWGYSIGEPNPQDPQLCAPIVGDFSEACSAVTVEVMSIETIDYPTNTVVRAETFGNGVSACVRPHPSYLDTSIAMADYRVTYRVRDSWNNLSNVRTWRGYFTQSSATATCSHTVQQHTISDSE
jgi:hypothetical protein